jgi:hypothetical protein
MESQFCKNQTESMRNDGYLTGEATDNYWKTDRERERPEESEKAKDRAIRVSSNSS